MYLPRQQVAGQARCVGIGQCFVGGPGDVLRATLGSCVGICLVHAATGRFALSHILLPSANGGNLNVLDQPARYVDTVLPHMLEELDCEGDGRRSCVAYIAGGAGLFEGNASSSQVGMSNCKALATALRRHKIRVVGQDLGGSSGRQLIADGVEARAFTIHLDRDDEGPSWEFPGTFPGPRSRRET